MGNALTIIIFILGFVLILKGGDVLVSSSVKLASKAKIPPMIVGATIVSIATTFPETTVSLISSFKGVEEIGINTAIGSTVCNFTIVLGMSFLICPTRVSSSGFLSKIVYFLVCVVVLFVFGINGIIGVFEAVVLLLMLVGFVVINLREAKTENTTTDVAGLKDSWVKIIIEFVISALAIGLGAIVLVENVDAISEMIGVKSGVVSFVIIAIGTNIPELVTTFTSVKLESPEIGIGNIFGASIIDCTLLIACSVFASAGLVINVSKLIILFTMPTLILITTIIAFPIIRSGKTTRFQGAMLIIIYILYTYLICTKV